MLFLILSILLNLSFLPLQDGSEVINSIQKKFKSIDDLEANFEQIGNAGLASGVLNFNGKFYYKKSGNFRIEMNNNFIISDGEKIWNYDKKLNRVIISPITEDPLSFSLEKFIIEYPEQCDIELVINSKSEKVVKLIPQNEFLGFASATLHTNESYLVNKIVIEDYTNNKFTFKLTDFRLNQYLNNSLFIFSPPEGTEIIDLR